jgi:hypothetical protein
MTALTDILRTLPLEKTTRPGELVLRWCDELAVVVLETGEIGQFVAAGVWSRAEVEAAVQDQLRLLRS